MVPIPIGPGVVLECESTPGGTRVELLRSLCQLSNNTDMQLEVRAVGVEPGTTAQGVVAFVRMRLDLPVLSSIQAHIHT